MEILSTADVAKKLNVSAIRVRQLIKEGRLPAQRIGRDYVVQEKDLNAVKNRPTGRPKKDNGIKATE